MKNQPLSPALWDRVRHYIRRRVRDAHLADDLTQDVMLRAHVHRHDLPHTPNQLVAWALRVARNLIIDHHRSARVLTQSLAPGHEPAPAAEPTAASELAGCLIGMVRHLPAKYRRAVELAEFEGWPQQAVARELNLSLSGAKSRIQRGRVRLRELIEQCCRIEQSAAGGIASFEPTAWAKEFCDAGEKSCVH